jgi:ribosome biogenesis GTPase
VLPRHSVFVRKSARQRDEPQIIAANIDVIFVVTSANKEFDPRRIERYVAAVTQSGALPVLVLNKVDLCQAPEALLETLGDVRKGLPIVCVSARERHGKEALLAHIGANATVALVGMSGTGKSSIANWLVGREALATGAIAEHGDLGKHTTSHRELFLLPGGGALIDTPGMRELGLWMDIPDLLESFPDITRLAEGCRFGDCQHTGEPGCAVRSAIAAGELGRERIEHFHELRRKLSDRAGSAPGAGAAPRGALAGTGGRRKPKRH